MMRQTSLQAMRSRVERLAQACGTDDEEPLLVHWGNLYNTCPSCEYDLDAHACREAIADAERDDGPDAPPRRVVVYWCSKTLTTCPRCGDLLETTWPKL
jgi:hypothetical protein